MTAGPAAADRAVDWGGIHNARDLGGLPLVGGGVTARGRVFRSSRPDALGPDGWAAVRASGVVTVIDLRNPGEADPDGAAPDDLDVHLLPIDDLDDPELLDSFEGDYSDPDYYAEGIRRRPDLFAAPFRAIAAAPADAAVLVHCTAGRDRTGVISALLLQLVGVERDAVLADYEIGMREQNAYLASLDDPKERPRSAAELEARIPQRRARLAALLDEVDLEALLRGQGLDADAVDALRARLRPTSWRPAGR